MKVYPKKELSDFKHDLFTKLQETIVAVALMRNSDQIDRLIQVPKEPMNILINVNEQFMNDNNEIKSFLGLAQNYFA